MFNEKADEGENNLVHMVIIMSLMLCLYIAMHLVEALHQLAIIMFVHFRYT